MRKNRNQRYPNAKRKSVRHELRFEEEAQNPASLDKSSAHGTHHVEEPIRRKSKHKHKFKVENAGARADVAAGDSPAVMAQSASTSSSNIPSAGAVGQGQNFIPFDRDLLAESAQTIYAETPDDTDAPDSNVSVSAVETTIGTAAGFIGHMAADRARAKPKKQSKLKYDRHKLKFAEDERGNDDVGGAGDTSDNAATQDSANKPGNSDNRSENEKQSDKRNSGDEQSADSGNGGNTQNSSTENSTQDNQAADTKADGWDNGGNIADDTTRPPPADSSRRTSANSTDDTASGTADPAYTTAPADGKSKSKLQFSKEEKQISKLERKSDKYGKKLDKAKDKLPTKTVKKKERVYDEKKGKTVSKLSFEKEVVPIGEAKWNNPKPKSLGVKATTAATSMAVTKIHAKIHQVEHENVGVKAAHKAELMGESAYRGSKQAVKSAYRFHKNRPYRKVAELEQKSIKNKMKLDYKKALRDNPKLKSNPLSRFMQKRAIKRNYAKDLRNAKNAAQTTKQTVGIVAKAGKIVTAIIRKNPVFLIKLGLILLVFFLIMSLFTMCVAMFSGGSSFIGAVTYPAEAEDITDASVLMTELETDLRIYILEIEENHPGFDEYRLEIGTIGHNPFELIAFLSAVYHDFTFAEVEATIRAVFDAMYTLELEEATEIRQREETRTGTGSWTDSEGNTHTYSYTYTVIVEYEWHILYVTLTSRPMSEVIADMMDEEQTQHFNILMQSHGARQFIGNPFEFNWMPYMTSPFGYRVHPIHGDKRFHWGIDIAAPTGTPLLATFDGVVVYVGYHPTGYGNIVIIENEDGVQARFAHCHEIFVAPGHEVERGDIIASVGNTGASTGAHLHLEIAVNGVRINPLFFVEFRN